jgi:hypothetical protein
MGNFASVPEGSPGQSGREEANRLFQARNDCYERCVQLAPPCMHAACVSHALLHIPHDSPNHLHASPHVYACRSRRAYQQGNGALAKQLSNEGKEYDRRAKAANKRASEAVFQANNANRLDGAIDLHGLHVSEACARARQEMERAKAEGRKKCVFIVGRGLHSQDGVARIDPAVQQLIESMNLRCMPDCPSRGCITAELVKPEERGWFWGFQVPQCVIC